MVYKHSEGKNISKHPAHRLKPEVDPRDALD